MTTLADLFKACFRNSGIDFAAIRVHPAGADHVCRTLRARAFTVGSDIYFTRGAFAPHTREGLHLLAHEVAHVVQQRYSATVGTERVAVAPPGTPQEREADAAAGALLAGRPFVFAPGSSQRRPVIQRYMAWEHCMLGDMDPALLREAAAGGPSGRGRAQLDAQCALLEQLGRQPRDVDQERLHADHPGLETVLLPGSGLVVTLGELNVLPDYLSHPAEIETAPAEFLTPLLQSIRSWSIAELRRSAGRPTPRHLLQGSLRYPKLRGLAEICEAVEVDALGKRCGFQPWDLYSSVVGRNAAHFAPFSWYRWQSFHLMAREQIARSRTTDGDVRESLRTRARIYAGYADHFLQDSYAAGHLINKTLVMQWYVEWLAHSRIPYLDRRLLARLTASRQPFIHGPDRYGRPPAAGCCPAQDPQTAAEAPTLQARIKASGVIGDTERDIHEAYAAYLSMLGNSVAQLAAGVVHGYFNKHSLVVAAGPDGPRFRLHGDRTLLAGGEGALRAARAAEMSRRAISELMHRGGTDITSQEIFTDFPDHVEQNGALVSLRQWHDTSLHDLCFHELFGRWRTRAMRILLSTVSRRLGVSSADIETLRNWS
jgi:hypothetical protein